MKSGQDGEIADHLRLSLLSLFVPPFPQASQQGSPSIQALVTAWDGILIVHIPQWTIPSTFSPLNLHCHIIPLLTQFCVFTITKKQNTLCSLHRFDL